MSIQQLNIGSPGYPELLKNIYDPPKKLHLAGALPDSPLYVSVIGSRRPTPYGKAMAHKLAYSLAQAGVCIVSGLALGIDAIAHQAALEAKGRTVAVMAHGLDTIQPTSNRQLAVKILESGGGLASEYAAGTPALKQNFVARNRLVSGLSHGVLVIESTKKSGTSITASFALEQGRTVMAVPGNADSLLSEGTNNLIKAGATLVTDPSDVFLALNFKHNTKQAPVRASSAQEQTILDLIYRGINDGSQLLAGSQLAESEFSQSLTLLEIAGTIRNIGNNHWIITS